MPDEALQEMRLMGKDLVGASAVGRIQSGPVPEVVENLLNEREDSDTLALANEELSNNAAGSSNDLIADHETGE